ncbi:aspartate aminotransferase family protein [bacterium]|nr:aspartate aminotransferase family protein [bacterium]MBU1073092.1 aspartate aminotransferase family protein [bacterium]MBU1677203.1 aspartate aminotransferase family protein [bacterium]
MSTLPPCGHTPRPYDGPTKDEVRALRAAYCHPVIFTLYKEPLMIVEGALQYLFDETGKRYLDLFAGIVTVSCGHSHPVVNRRVIEQVEKLQHATTLYLHPNFPQLGAKLAAKMPDGLDVTYFTNSGSEANELAIAMARMYTGREDVIAVRNAYHGGTTTAMGLTSHSTWKFPLHTGGRVHHAACPDPYRSKFAGSPEQIATKCAEDIRELIRFSTPGQVAAFIAEPIQGVGGVTCGAANYLPEAYAVIREHGGVCIADEVQTGFGRTGDHYWGFENYGVKPDMVVMAKGIGNGFPLGAVTTTAEIAAAFTSRIHFNTFGGNPVSMAAGAAVLDVIEQEQLQKNCREVGGRFKAGLQKLQQTHDLIGDVRGKGLMLGVELVRDRVTKEPANTEAIALLEIAKDQGLLVGKGGFYGNVLRIKPPMCITTADVEFALEVLDDALGRV